MRTIFTVGLLGLAACTGGDTTNKPEPFVPPDNTDTSDVEETATDTGEPGSSLASLTARACGRATPPARIGTMPAGMNLGRFADWSIDDSSFARLTIDGQAEIYRF